VLYKDVNRNNGIKLNKENLGREHSWTASYLGPGHSFLREAIEAHCLEQQTRLEKTLENLPHGITLLC